MLYKWYVFPKEMLGDTYAIICEFLPFDSALTITKGILNNNIETITTQNIVIFCVYTIIILLLATKMFKTKMISDNK